MGGREGGLLFSPTAWAGAWGERGFRSRIPVFRFISALSAFSSFQGSKSRIPFFPSFPLLGAPNLEFRGHGSVHVWCGHVWRAKNVPPYEVDPQWQMIT